MRNIVLIMLLAFSACKTNQPLSAPAGVYKVSVLYPASEGKTFDMKY
jgi:hypothetical protein